MESVIFFRAEVSSLEHGSVYSVNRRNCGPDSEFWVRGVVCSTYLTRMKGRGCGAWDARSSGGKWPSSERVQKKRAPILEFVLASGLEWMSPGFGKLLFGQTSQLWVGVQGVGLVRLISGFSGLPVFSRFGASERRSTPLCRFPENPGSLFMIPEY